MFGSYTSVVINQQIDLFKPNSAGNDQGYHATALNVTIKTKQNL